MRSLPLLSGLHAHHIYNSDIHNPEGVEHAQAIATAIASSSMDSRPSQVYCSPFTRTVHTAHIIQCRMQPHLKNCYNCTVKMKVSTTATYYVTEVFDEQKHILNL